MWIDNEDGTFTAEQGDTLWDLYGSNWQEMSGYEGDPTKLQPGDVVGKQNTTTVYAEGSGVEYLFSAVLGDTGGQIGYSEYSVNFTIKETGEKFSSNFRELTPSASGFNLSAGISYKMISGEGIFKGKRPSKSDIVSSFTGDSDSFGFSVLFAGVSGYETKNWIVNTGTYSLSIGSPISFGFEKSFTEEK